MRKYKGQEKKLKAQSSKLKGKGMMSAMIIAAIMFFAGPVMAQTYGTGLQWDRGANGPGVVKGYIVYFSDDPAIPEKFNVKVTWDLNSDGEVDTTVDFVVLQLEYGVSYDFYVIAYTDAGPSGPSNIVSGGRMLYVPPDDNLPPAPAAQPANPENAGMQ